MLPHLSQTRQPADCYCQPRQHNITSHRFPRIFALNSHEARDRQEADIHLKDQAHRVVLQQQHVVHNLSNSNTVVHQQPGVMPPWSLRTTASRQQLTHQHYVQQQTCLSPTTSAYDPQHHDDQHEDHDHHMTKLQQILQISPSDFSVMTQQLPAIVSFQPHTLHTTLDALCDVLHINQHSLTSLLQQRPKMLLSPHEAVLVQQQLCSLLCVTPKRLANLMGSQYCHLMTMTPQDLQIRVTSLSEVMGWRSDGVDTIAATIGPESFLHLLSSPPSQTAQQLTVLAAALDCSEAQPAVAAVVQHYPRLLDRRDFLIWPQLKLLADTAGVTARQLLSELDVDQCKGLSSILLYEPVWIAAQLRRLTALLRDQQPTWSDRMMVWLLLRLATPNTLARAKVQMEALQRLVSTHQPWQDEVQHADDRQLAVLLTADDESLQLLQFLVDLGRESECGFTLAAVVACSEAVFRRKYGQIFEEWLEGRRRAAAVGNKEQQQ